MAKWFKCITATFLVQTGDVHSAVFSSLSLTSPVYIYTVIENRNEGKMSHFKKYALFLKSCCHMLI